MRYRLFTFFAAAILPVTALAERYGSETTVTLQGAYYIAGATSTQILPNGDTRDTASQSVIQINNSTVLQAMSSRSLIPGVAGYRLVMVARAHMADGVSWFATKTTGTPVAVPADLFTLDVSDGPTSGQLVVSAHDVLKSLNQQTHNQAGLILNKFIGTGMLTQTWSARPVKNGTATEVVELVSSTGTFTGAVMSAPNAGVGSIDFKLTGAKTVDLTRYGMVTTGNSGISGSVIINRSNTGNSVGGTLTMAGSGNISVGTVNLGADDSNNASTQLNAGGVLLSGGASGIAVGNNSQFIGNTSIITINTTSGGTLPGLVVDADGNVTQFPIFGTSLPGTLVIITSSGTHPYTHDANGVWTLVAP